MNAAILATLIPLAALYFMIPLDEAPPWPAAVPFGWPMLLVAHVLAGLPLALTLGRLVPEKLASVGLALGLLGAALTVLLGATMGTALEGMGLIPRHLVRVLWCLALQWPWAVAVRGPWPASISVAILSLAIAVTIPAMYLRVLLRDSSTNVDTLIQNSRVPSALRLLSSRVAVGSGEGPRLATLITYHKQLELAAKSGNRLPALLQLERLDEAAALLQRGTLDAAGWKVLGVIRQKQGRFAESDAALEKALSLATGDQAKIEIIDSLAFNARETTRFRRSEELYLDALEQFPEHAAYLHFQLGRHYHAGNRVPEALQHFKRASERDPSAYREPASAFVLELRRQTPGCLLRWP
jgi:hypothetical protein